MVTLAPGSCTASPQERTERTVSAKIFPSPGLIIMAGGFLETLVSLGSRQAGDGCRGFLCSFPSSGYVGLGACGVRLHGGIVLGLCDVDAAGFRRDLSLEAAIVSSLSQPNPA